MLLQREDLSEPPLRTALVELLGEPDDQGMSTIKTCHVPPVPRRPQKHHNTLTEKTCAVPQNVLLQTFICHQQIAHNFNVRACVRLHFPVNVFLLVRSCAQSAWTPKGTALMTVFGLSALICLTGSLLSSDPFDQHLPI